MPGTETAKDVRWMQEALKEAKKALEEDEVPVGAVVVSDDRVIATAHNLCEREKNPLRHAELLALEASFGELRCGKNRLQNCALYVTMEPCPMCMGALVHARIGRIVYGTKDAQAGALDSMINIRQYPFGRQLDVTGGVSEEDCRKLLSEFFAGKRKK